MAYKMNKYFCTKNELDKNSNDFLTQLRRYKNVNWDKDFAINFFVLDSCYFNLKDFLVFQLVHFALLMKIVIKSLH